MTLSTRLGDPRLLFEAYNHRVIGAMYVGDRATLDTDIDAVEALAAQLREPGLEHRSRSLRVAQSLMSGRLDDAERELGALNEYAATHRIAGTGSAAALTFQLYYERGRLAELEPFLAQTVLEQKTTVAALAHRVADRVHKHGPTG